MPALFDGPICGPHRAARFSESACIGWSFAHIARSKVRSQTRRLSTRTVPPRRRSPGGGRTLGDRAVQMASPGGLVVLAWPFPLREPLGFSEGRKTRAPTGTWCKQPSQTACLVWAKNRVVARGKPRARLGVRRDLSASEHSSRLRVPRVPVCAGEQRGDCGLIATLAEIRTGGLYRPISPHNRC